jgi:non-homologous end joining protein Ku
MNYRSFTNENAKRMEDLVKAKQEEIDALKKTTAKQMWIDDINAILELLDKSSDMSKKPTKTRAATRTRQSRLDSYYRYWYCRKRSRRFFREFIFRCRCY